MIYYCILSYPLRGSTFASRGRIFPGRCGSCRGLLCTRRASCRCLCRRRCFPGCCCAASRCFRLCWRYLLIGCSCLPMCYTFGSSTILLGFLFSTTLQRHHLGIADRVLPGTRDNHQASAVGTEIGYRTLPHSKIASRIAVAAIEETLLLLGVALNQVATAVWAKSPRFSDKGTTIAAFWETRAGDETTKPARANDEITLTFGATFIYLLYRLLHAIHLGLCLLHAHLEIAIEAAQELRPGLPSLLDIVQFPLHLSSAARIDNVGEVLVHDLVDGLSQPGRHKATLLLVDIATVLNRANNRHIRAWTSDALFFQLFDQACLCITWRRLGEVLGRFQLMQVKYLVGAERRQ